MLFSIHIHAKIKSMAVDFSFVPTFGFATMPAGIAALLRRDGIPKDPAQRILQDDDDASGVRGPFSILPKDMEAAAVQTLAVDRERKATSWSASKQAQKALIAFASHRPYIHKGALGSDMYWSARIRSTPFE